jgi:CHAT domain-containing protein
MPANRIVLAEYFTTDDITLLFGVRTDWDEPEVVEIQQPLNEIRKYVMDNFGVTEEKEGQEKYYNSFEKIQNLDLDEWQSRFAPFIEPVLKWTEPGDYLYLVPHDVLHYLPLHTLKVEGGYLIERNPVLYTPSASVLKYCQAKRKGRRENILVLGDSDTERPLSYARSEALEVADIFGTQPYLGQDARKSLVKEKLEKERDDIDILHFACHGYFHQYQALKSGILMAPEPDGGEKPAEFETTLQGLPISRYLTAEEFFGMEMHADLVTLSACESGVNQLRPGDELFGLMRALIYAGTPSVVMTQWEVDDISTELLMVHFYKRLKAGDTKVEALQKAQLHVKELSAAEAKAYYESKVDKATTADDNSHQKLEEAKRSIYRKLLAEEQEGRPVGMDCKLFNHPAYWAPFILVGDWK